MSFGHHHQHPNEDHLRELAKIEKSAWYKKERRTPIEIDHTHEVPYLGGSSKIIDGKRIIFVDHRAYPLIKKLGLLDGLIEHEWVESILLDHGYSYADAHEFATAAENNVYRRQGKPPKQVEQHYPKLLKLTEGEPITNIDPRLRLEPYKAKPQKPRLLQQMQGAMKQAA